MMNKSFKKFLDLPNPNAVEEAIIEEEKQFEPSFVA